MQISKNSTLHLKPGTVVAPMHSLCQKKATDGNGEPENVILDSVQKAHFVVRAFKVPSFMQRHIGPTVQSSRNSGLLLTIVP